MSRDQLSCLTRKPGRIGRTRLEQRLTYRLSEQTARNSYNPGTARESSSRSGKAYCLGAEAVARQDMLVITIVFTRKDGLCALSHREGHTNFCTNRYSPPPPFAADYLYTSLRAETTPYAMSSRSRQELKASIVCRLVPILRLLCTSGDPLLVLRNSPDHEREARRAAWSPCTWKRLQTQL